MPIDFNHVVAFAVNLLCHIFILLTFLMILFFEIIAPMTANHIDQELHSILQQSTTDFMQTINQYDTHHWIDWKNVKTLTSNLKKQYETASQEVEQNNNQVMNDCVCFLTLFGVSIIVLIIYLLIRQVEIRLKFLVLENIVIFLLVGFFEVYFFLNIASDYVAVLPNAAIETVISQLKYRLSQ